MGACHSGTTQCRPTDRNRGMPDEAVVPPRPLLNRKNRMSDLHAVLLGTGTPAPNPHRCGPSTLIASGKASILVDCGSGAVVQLVKSGRSPAEINTIFLTHLHSDHYIDLDHFIVTRWILGGTRPLTIHGPRGINRMVDHWMAIHAYDIDMRIKTRKQTKVPPIVRVHEIDEGTIFENDSLKVIAFRVSHYPLDEPYGFRFESSASTIVVSGDTCPCENVVRHARGADLLIHECVDYSNIQVREGDGWANIQERLVHLGKTHTLPTELGRIARDADVSFLATTHMVERSEPEKIRSEISKDFSGKLAIGEDLMKLELS